MRWIEYSDSKNTPGENVVLVSCLYWKSCNLLQNSEFKTENVGVSRSIYISARYCSMFQAYIDDIDLLRMVVLWSDNLRDCKQYYFVAITRRSNDALHSCTIILIMFEKVYSILCVFPRHTLFYLYLLGKLRKKFRVIIRIFLAVKIVKIKYMNTIHSYSSYACRLIIHHQKIYPEGKCVRLSSHQTSSNTTRFNLLCCFHRLINGAIKSKSSTDPEWGNSREQIFL